MQLHHARARNALGILAATIAAGGLFAAQAGAHARVYPNTVAKGSGAAYSLVVPNESEDASITEVKITVPDGFLIGGFQATAGWERSADSEGEGHSAVTKTVTWSGGDVPPGEAAWFHFTGRPDDEQGADLTEYRFAVEQTYSDGTVANWAGPEDSDEPAPVVEITSAGGSSGAAAAVTPEQASPDDGEDDESNTTATIALIVGILALLLGLAGFARRGSRPLT